MLVATVGYSQGIHFLSDHPAKRITDRWLILHDFPSYSSTVGNRPLEEMNMMATHLYKQGLSGGVLDHYDIRYVYNETSEYAPPVDSTYSPERDKNDGFQLLKGERSGDFTLLKNRRPILKHFYKNEADLFRLDLPSFSLRINPILGLGFGKEQGGAYPIFQNTRGVEVRSIIDDRVYMYMTVLENQQRFLNYLRKKITDYRAIPGHGLYKNYDSPFFDKIRGYDFLNAQGYLGYRMSKHVSAELGHGRHFIGDGIRSLLLSDYGHNYFYFKLNTNVWKLNYQNIFAELSPISSKQVSGDQLLPKKYMATHFLSFTPTSNLEFGLFESVVFSRADHFELQYLNPVILYRSVEQWIGSPDNVLLGFSARYNLLNRHQFYGQVIFDEFKFDEITGNAGWWANKYGLQAGVKTLNIFGVSHLDLQYEFNKVRPYTYAHRGQISAEINQSLSSYSHYNQPLAHPLGANFIEHIIQAHYKPTSRLYLDARMSYARYGLDEAGVSYGQNILRPTDDRLTDDDNTTTQGQATDVLGFYIHADYELFHDFYLGMEYVNRMQDSESEANNFETQYVGLSLRYNFNRTLRDF